MDERREPLLLYSPSEGETFGPDDTFGLAAERVTVTVGGKTKTFWRYILPDVVQVAAFVDGLLVLIQEYSASLGDYYTHIVGGSVDQTDPDQLFTAQRELREETGLESESWRLLSVMCHDSQRSRRRIHHYLAWDCQALGLPEIGITVCTTDLELYLTQQTRELLANPGETKGGLNTFICLQLAKAWLQQ